MSYLAIYLIVNMNFKETVCESLCELWISYNLIDKFKGIGALKNLKVFYCSNNLIKEWAEFNRLQVCTFINVIIFFYQLHSQNIYFATMFNS